MSELTAFRLTQGFYWLFLGVWIGAMVMFVITATSTFKTVPQFKPTLNVAPFNSPALAENAPRILAGAVTGNALRGLTVLQWVCAGGVAACVILQTLAFGPYLSGGAAGAGNLVRIALLVAPLLVLAVDQAVITPRLIVQRDAMYNAEATPEARGAAGEVFHGYHKISEGMSVVAVLCLVGAVLASPFVFRTSRDGVLGITSTPAGKDVARG